MYQIGNNVEDPRAFFFFLIALYYVLILEASFSNSPIPLHLLVPLVNKPVLSQMAFCLISPLPRLFS